MKHVFVRASLVYIISLFCAFWLSGCDKNMEPAASIVPASPSAAMPTIISEPSAVSESPVPTESVGSAPQVAQNTVLSSFTTADFSGPGVCNMCHTAITDETGTDVSILSAWRSTLMANGAKDPVWQAKVSSEVARLPQLQAVIEQKCVACHMPMADTQTVVDGGQVAALNDGFFNPDHPLHEAAIEGVSCTLCHQIQDENLGQMESFSGGYVIDTSTNPPDRPNFGPYTQPFVRPMQMHSGFTPEFREHTGSAELCATCHNLFTPFVDSQGNILGEFPEQTPFAEWQQSTFGAANIPCQTCHMPQANGGVVISTMPGNLAAREPFFQHFFVGGNAFMLQILQVWGSELEVTADEVHFANTQSRIIQQIGSSTAKLTLVGIELEENILTAQLKVTPLTGHKFPTGFPARRAWLHVIITDTDGQVVFESGLQDSDGKITGNDADFDPAAYEPHYDLITQPDQVQIYEPVMANTEGQVTYTLLRAASYIKDNRLLPAGVMKADLPEIIAVNGAAANDENFDAGGDQVTYQVDLASAQGPFTFRAELLYAPLSYRFIQDLLLDDTPLVDRFEGYYNHADKSPLLVSAIAPTSVK